MALELAKSGAIQIGSAAVSGQFELGNAGVLTPMHRRTLLARGAWITVIMAVFTAVGLLMVFLLARTASNQARYEENYQVLFVVNVVVAVLLLLVIVWSIGVLWQRLRKGRFGARLLAKLAAVFAIAGLLPAAMVYLVSYQFLSRSIDSWFDVRVEQALDAGLSLAQNMLDERSSALTKKSKLAAADLASTPQTEIQSQMDKLRQQMAVQSLRLWNGQRQLVSVSVAAGVRTDALAPADAVFKTASSKGIAVLVHSPDAALSLDEAAANATENGAPPQEGASDSQLSILALAPLAHSPMGPAEPQLYLEAVDQIEPHVAKQALNVQLAYQEYQERALARNGLKRMYLGSLSLTLFLTCVLAIMLAFVLGSQLTRPLLLLAQGVHAVAEGDLSPKQFAHNRDELGGLTRDFARMTQQLSDARNAAEKGLSLAEESREHIQTILDNLTAGVVVLDAQFQIVLSNPSASRILHTDLEPGSCLADVPYVGTFGQGVQRAFGEWNNMRERHNQKSNRQRKGHWQSSFELVLPKSDADGQAGAQTPHLGQDGVQQGTAAMPGLVPVTLAARGARLSPETMLLVFDDISDIVSAERTQAWADVARRLAHEIKNPLTPIQLSAERIAFKLEGKLAQPELLFVQKSVNTIINQVGALKRLVNEFRDFGRLPAAVLVPMDVHELLREVLQMYQTPGAVEVVADLQAQPALVLGDANQLRQVVHNLIQNAMDATDSRLEQEHKAVDLPPTLQPDGLGLEPLEESRRTAKVTISTRLSEDASRLQLVIRDEGTGFDESILRRAFEPYVTTKNKGTGLGLAVVKKIIDEHYGAIEIGNISYCYHVDAEKTSKDSKIAGAQVTIGLRVAKDPQT